MKRKISIILFVISLICSISSFAQVSSLGMLHVEGALNDAEVENLLLSSNSVNEFLEKLSQNPKTSSYLSRFIPVWESSSLQRSLSHCPRLLLYNADASFVMSIVGCPSIEAGREDVEILQWNASSQEFELFSVHFATGKKPEIGEKNPKACMRCHSGGIAVGAHDAYTWKGTNLRSNAINLARLAVTSKIGQAAIYESGAFIRSVPIDRYKSFDVLSLIKKYPYIQPISVQSFIQNASRGDFTINQWQFINPVSNPSFQPQTPADDFNTKLAEKNHQRNVVMAKKIFGVNYDRYKYFLIAALSDCDNFAKMYPENPSFPDPYLSREGYEALQAIYDRIGLRVLQPRIEDTDDFDKALYTIKQLDTVRKVYYGFLSMNMDEEVKDLNFNPIKFTFHPAWGSANMVHAFLQDKDLKEMQTIKGIATTRYLRARSGLPENGFQAADTWNHVRTLFYKAKSDNKYQKEFETAFDAAYYQDIDFNAYCHSLELAFKRK